MVTANVRARDIGSFVAEAHARLLEKTPTEFFFPPFPRSADGRGPASPLLKLNGSSKAFGAGAGDHWPITGDHCRLLPIIADCTQLLRPLLPQKTFFQ